MTDKYLLAVLLCAGYGVGKPNPSDYGSHFGNKPKLLKFNRKKPTASVGTVLVQVIERFDFDPRELREDEAIGGDGLARRLTDQRFSDLNIDRDEITEFMSNAPGVAVAFARLYDQVGSNVSGVNDSLVASREVERWRNHLLI